ncbi:MAG: hypothetical protein V4574_13165 [Pseudomonadota bacterium]
MIRKGFLAGAAGWLALTGVAVQAQDVRAKQGGDACITAPEAEAFVLVIAPPVLREVARFCESELPASAYLRNSEALLAKFEAASRAAAPGAQAAVAKLMGPSGSSALLPPQDLMPMMLQMVGPMLTEELKAGDCPAYDRVLKLLDPLPADNAAALLITFAQMGTKNDKKPDFPLCPASNGL